MFKYLSGNLSSRYKSTVTQVQGILPMLCFGELPIVLTHGDLNEIDILVEGASHGTQSNQQVH